MNQILDLHGDKMSGFYDEDDDREIQKAIADLAKSVKQIKKKNWERYKDIFPDLYAKEFGIDRSINPQIQKIMDKEQEKISNIQEKNMSLKDDIKELKKANRKRNRQIEKLNKEIGKRDIELEKRTKVIENKNKEIIRLKGNTNKKLLER